MLSFDFIYMLLLQGTERITMSFSGFNQAQIHRLKRLLWALGDENFSIPFFWFLILMYVCRYQSCTYIFLLSHPSPMSIRSLRKHVNGVYQLSMSIGLSKWQRAGRFQVLMAFWSPPLHVMYMVVVVVAGNHYHLLRSTMRRQKHCKRLFQPCWGRDWL